MKSIIAFLFILSCLAGSCSNKSSSSADGGNYWPGSNEPKDSLKTNDDSNSSQNTSEDHQGIDASASAAEGAHPGEYEAMMEAENKLNAKFDIEGEYEMMSYAMGMRIHEVFKIELDLEGHCSIASGTYGPATAVEHDKMELKDCNVSTFNVLEKKGKVHIGDAIFFKPESNYIPFRLGRDNDGNKFIEFCKVCATVIAPGGTPEYGFHGGIVHEIPCKKNSCVRFYKRDDHHKEDNHKHKGH